MPTIPASMMVADLASRIAEGDPVEVETRRGKVQAPAGFAFEPVAQRITGSASVPGTYLVSLVASDGQTPPGMATNSFTIRITEPLTLTFEISSGSLRLRLPGTAGGNLINVDGMLPSASDEAPIR